MDKQGIVQGQKVSQELQARAKDLRRNMTPAENRLWSKLRTNRLNNWHFRRQQIIDGFIVDFYCHRAGLIIEIDGPIHKKQVIEDNERTRVFEDRGLKILRFTNKQIMNELNKVLNVILEKLEVE